MRVGCLISVMNMGSTEPGIGGLRTVDGARLQLAAGNARDFVADYDAQERDGGASKGLCWGRASSGHAVGPCTAAALEGTITVRRMVGGGPSFDNVNTGIPPLLYGTVLHHALRMRSPFVTTTY